MKNNAINKIPRRQRGASMIEVIVSVFIFAVGVLGFASLQSRSIQATFDNTQRDQVVWLSQSLIDRVRVNKPGATTYASALTDFDFADCSTPPALCDAGTCTSTQMATYDVWDMYCRNSFQGASAIRGLSVNLECIDADGDDTVCAPSADLILTTNWCARGIESTEGLDSAADDACENTIAEMEYRVGFRP
ncbi:MAG: type IV pilus modification protein PilV [Porticoccaceae bacterium]